MATWRERLDKACPAHATPYRAKNGNVQFKPKMSWIMGCKGDDRGFCLACAQEWHNVEPDTTARLCPGCGERKVYGLEQLVLMDLVHFDV